MGEDLVSGVKWTSFLSLYYNIWKKKKKKKCQKLSAIVDR